MDGLLVRWRVDSSLKTRPYRKKVDVVEQEFEKKNMIPIKIK